MEWRNQLLPVASVQDFKDALKINADATVYRCSLEKGHVIHFYTLDNRRTFIYMSVGELTVNGQRIEQGDQARIDLEQVIHMESVCAGQPAEFILIDVST